MESMVAPFSLVMCKFNQSSKTNPNCDFFVFLFFYFVMICLTVLMVLIFILQILARGVSVSMLRLVKQRNVAS